MGKWEMYSHNGVCKMNNEEKKYPLVQKALKSFVEDEEGNIPAKKLLSIGSLIILLGTILSIDIFLI